MGPCQGRPATSAAMTGPRRWSVRLSCVTTLTVPVDHSVLSLWESTRCME
jgi:hypothetical protein